MARKRTTTAQQPAEDPMDFDPAKLEAQAAPPAEANGRSHAASVRKRQTQEHSKLTIPAGDMLVHLLDKADNAAGIGIRIEFPEGSKGRPTEEEKEIIRRHVMGEPGQESGFGWNRKLGMWHKDIVREGENPRAVPPNRAIAIRLDAERRVHNLADALRHHAADPAGYAARIEQERERAGQGQEIPM
jgi:hypothetical protein